MLDIEITKLYKSEIDKIVNWYNQSDKGWLYCDDPSYTVDKFQECGYGKQALDKTINLIKSNGRFKIDKVELEVRYENLSALTLYWKTGFRPVAFDCFSYWTMELIIDDYS